MCGCEGRFDHLGGASVMTSQQVSLCENPGEENHRGRRGERMCVCVYVCVCVS